MSLSKARAEGEEDNDDGLRQAKEGFISQLMETLDDQGMTITELGLRANTSCAATSRMQDPGENITLRSMCRFAAAAGKSVRIDLVDGAGCRPEDGE